LFHARAETFAGNGQSKRTVDGAGGLAVTFEETIYALVPVMTLVGLFAVAAFWISRRAHLRELAHRERLAMIEKGLIPPAEMHPGLVDPSGDQSGAAGTLSSTAGRFRSAGVMLVGLGVAVALVIGVAAHVPNVGLGIGGGIAAIGAAMIVNGMLAGGRTAPGPAARVQPPILHRDLEERP
jgi:hypothetical protein